MAQLKNTTVDGILEIQGKDENGKSLILPEGSKIYVGNSEFTGGGGSGESTLTPEQIEAMGFIKQDALNNYVTNNTIAGNALGLVKNGNNGNVIINSDGTMTAPTGGGSTLTENDIEDMGFIKEDALNGYVTTIELNNKGYITNTKVGGNSLGLVKNGGNVIINQDGTMTAPEGTGGGSGEANVQSDWNENTKTSDAFIKNKPPIENDSGEKSLIIGDGKALGAHSIAGGTNDKDLINIKELVHSNILGDLINFEVSESLGVLSASYGAGNKALTSGTLALGINNLAGCRGFYWNSFYGENYAGIILTSVEGCGAYGFPQVWDDEASEQLSHWKIGDIISIQADISYNLSCTIVEVNPTEGRIKVDKLPFDPNNFDFLPGNLDCSLCFVVNPNEPLRGVIDTNFLATAIGLDNKATGFLSHAEGCSNISGGEYSHTEGLGNLAGYCAHAQGAYTKAIGNYSHTEGVYTKGLGEHSHAEGYGSKALGFLSHAEGDNSEASGKTSHSEGYKTVASGNYSHAEGCETEAGYCAHAEGCLTRALGDHSHAEGHGCQALGRFSHAEGGGTVASGNHSHAEGDHSEAIEEGSHAEGYRTVASGNYSHAEGKQSKARGPYSHAEGYNCTAVGHYSHVEGYETYAEHDYSHAEGYQSKATSGSHTEGVCTEASSGSHAEGYYSKATGLYSHAEGCATKAYGDYSHTEGRNTIAEGNYQHVQGRFNISDVDANGNPSNIYAHIVGNGTKENPSNAHTLDWYGNAWYQGSVKSNGEDYAEYFEWLDGNPDKEDRVGLLVTLDGEKIKLATPEDEILGVISGTVAVLGGTYECEWNGKYLTDNFGRVIYDMVEDFIDIEKVEHKEVEKEIVDEETNETRTEIVIEEVITTETKSLGFFKQPRLNPNYDPDKNYINRSDRPEWDAVGMLGKLYVRDDGTCIPNYYATVGGNGIATLSLEKTNMRVLSRVNENVVRVLLK